MRFKILLVAGVGKSGSTLVGALLGQLAGFLNVGEVISIEHARREGHLCGCGMPVGDCRFWGPILDEGIGGVEHLDSEQWGRLHTLTLFSRNLRRPNRANDSDDAGFPQLHSLYDALGTRAEGAVVVDGSKSYRYAKALSEIPDVELFILHLIRDPRAVEESKSRLSSGGHWKFNAKSTFYNSVQWVGLNLLLETLALRKRYSYRRVRYEDLIHKPGESIAGIAEWVTGARQTLEIDSEGGVFLGSNHTLGGSDVRRQSGRVVLEPRERWLHRLPLAKKRLVTLLSLPLLIRYGYPVRPALTEPPSSE